MLLKKITCCAKREKKINCREEKSQPPPLDIKWSVPKPVHLEDITVNSLSYADDLILISETSEGIQKCLDKLHSYCYKWGLKVNSKKTNCVTFGKKQKNVKVYYGNAELNFLES